MSQELQGQLSCFKRSKVYRQSIPTANLRKLFLVSSAICRHATPVISAIKNLCDDDPLHATGLPFPVINRVCRHYYSQAHACLRFNKMGTITQTLLI